MKPALVHAYLAGLTGVDDSDCPLIISAILGDYHRGAERFAKTYLEHEPCADHDLHVVIINGEINDRVRKVYARITCHFSTYTGTGWDIGAYQSVAAHLSHDFAVFMTTKTHFKRAGWLLEMLYCKSRFGNGLYGAMASCEACPLTPEKKPNPHIRTAFFGINPQVLAAHPKIESRQECFRFESGRMGLTESFLTQKLPVKMVTWDGCYDVADWRKPDNIFRKGDQSNLIAFDRHADSYEHGNHEEKALLERIANGECGNRK